MSEAAAIARACASTGREFAISLLARDDAHLVSGEPIGDAVDAVLAVARPVALMLNCVPAATMHAPLHTLRAAVQTRGDATLPLGAYANTGNPFDPGASVTDIPTYVEHAAAWHALGAHVIGGCCGTTPEYIAALVARFHPVADSETST